MKETSTGDATCWKLQGSSTSLEDMMKSTERGLLVTRPVKNLRYNESPIFMLNNVMAMGRPERVSASEAGGPGQAISVPPLKVRDFTFTSTSDAI